MTRGHLTDRTRSYTTLWSAAVRLREFSYHDLAGDTGWSVDRAALAVREWEAEGVALRLGKGKKNRMRFRLVDPDRRLPARLSAAPVRSGSATGNMWTAMRHLGSFSARDIAAHATTDSVAVGLDSARAYCRLLDRGGYLRLLKKPANRHQDAIWRLIRNTGPKPPREARVTVIWDDNRDEPATPLRVPT